MEYYIKTDKFGNKFYYKKDTKRLHREDGPAALYNSGHKEWFINGKRHRADGPAIEYTSGNKSWYINGKRLSPEKEAILNKWWNNKNDKNPM